MKLAFTKHCKFLFPLWILFTTFSLGINADLSSMSPPLLHECEAIQSSFHENYEIVKEIGRGSYGCVFLCKNHQGQLYAAKQYTVSEPFIEHLEKLGISASTFINHLASKELEIGQLADHPNIVKIHEVVFEEASAYVIMDYIEGNTLDLSAKFSTKMRTLFMQQFLSAIEHLLLRNIIVDDLWSGNIMIFKETLTLIDLGGYDFIGRDADMPLNHYLEGIEDELAHIGQEAAKRAISNCSHLIPADLREETISTSHIRILVYWIEALQNELSTPIHMDDTIHAETPAGIMAAYNQLQT